jgi:hypothetical protein
MQMSFYAATLGEIFIVQIFVFIIWLKVLFEAMRSRDNSVSGRKFLLTASGLVINSLAIAAIMAFRFWELITNHWPYVPAISGFFVMLGVAGFLWIIGATIGQSTRLLKAFLVTSALWTALCLWVWFSK